MNDMIEQIKKEIQDIFNISNAKSYTVIASDIAHLLQTKYHNNKLIKHFQIIVKPGGTIIDGCVNIDDDLTFNFTLPDDLNNHIKAYDRAMRGI